MTTADTIAIGVMVGSIGGAAAALAAQAIADLVEQSYPQHCLKCKQHGRASWPHRAAHHTAWWLDAVWWAIRDRADRAGKAVQAAMWATEEALRTAGICAHNVAASAAQWAADTVGSWVRAALHHPTENGKSPENPEAGK